MVQKLFKSNFKKIIALILLVLFPVELVFADWVDDMIGQFQSVGPSYFSGEQRGYVGFGSFGVRYPTKSDYLFSIEPPRIQAGCGGIDIYLGSFSYLNPEYLVQKLERILKVAPAMAFQLALSTLCETCQKIMSELEAIANFFNSLQLDECQASKALVAYTMNKLTGETKEKLRAEADRAKQLYENIGTSWQEMTDIFKKDNYKVQSKVKDLLGKCSPQTGEIVTFGGTPDDSGLQGGYNTLLQYLAQRKNWGYIGNISVWRYISAITGDIEKVPVIEDGKLVDIIYIVLDSCLEDLGGLTPEGLAKVPLMYRDDGLSCQQIQGKTVGDFVRENYQKAKDYILIKHGLDSSVTRFLNMVSGPAYRTVLNAIMSQDPAIESMVLDYIGRMFLIHLLQFATQEAEKMIRNVDYNMKVIKNPETCQSYSYLEDLYSRLQEYSQQIMELRHNEVLRNGAELALKSLEASLNAAQQYVNYEREIRDKFITLMLGTDTQNKGGRKR
jgi:hypothetical protein